MARGAVTVKALRHSAERHHGRLLVGVGVTEGTMRTFTLEELAEFDGRDGKPAYVAYDGLVYDVSAGPTWMNGDHLGHSAGEDLTDAMGEAPHGEEVFEGMPVVGKVAG